ncbi:MAG: NAD(P)H-quinone oxidoreductase [Pseudomonadota bacterium]
MLPETMKTVEIREPGGPDVLQAGTRPVPHPGAGEVLIRVAAAGVNGPDILQRRGHYPPPRGASDLLGLEVSGTVAALGADVADWAPGDPVCALTNGGGYAEYVAVEATHCLPLPDGLGLTDAAGLCETFFTCWSNLFLDHTPDPDQILLVHGGAGGIGSTAIQLGRQMGMRVLATCSADDAAYVRTLGAERAIDYAHEDFVSITRDAGAASLILDIIGGDYVARNIKAAAPDARIVQLAFRAGSKIEIDLMNVMLKRLVYTGSTLRSRPSAFKTRTAADLRRRVWPWLASGAVRTHTHQVFSFDAASQAHAMMEAGDHRGKLLITPEAP